MTDTDARLMARALELARRGHYSTSPNPRVGCVIARDGEVIAENWHRRAGEAHAEAGALEQLHSSGGDARGATAYVTLEPCSHFGRTPPCCDSLIVAGVARVVVAMTDPNPLVSGRGIERLRAAGIKVDIGLMQAEAEALNPGFIRRMREGLPQVRIKLAMSLDGRTAMASGESQWITGPKARADVQRLRAASCAIVTGVDTLLHDDAALTVRPEQFAPERTGEFWRQPLRVVLDSKLRTPVDGRLFAGGGPVLIVAANRDAEKQAALEEQGAEVLYLPDAQGRVDLAALLHELGERQCNEVLVEAGATLAGRFIAEDLAQQLTVYMAPTLMGSAARPLLQLPLEAMAQQRRLQIEEMRAVGDDWRIDARLLPATASEQEEDEG